MALLTSFLIFAFNRHSNATSDNQQRLDSRTKAIQQSSVPITNKTNNSQTYIDRILIYNISRQSFAPESWRAVRMSSRLLYLVLCSWCEPKATGFGLELPMILPQLRQACYSSTLDESHTTTTTFLLKQVARLRRFSREKSRWNCTVICRQLSNLEAAR